MITGYTRIGLCESLDLDLFHYLLAGRDSVELFH